MKSMSIKKKTALLAAIPALAMLAAAPAIAAEAKKPVECPKESAVDAKKPKLSNPCGMDDAPKTEKCVKPAADASKKKLSNPCGMD